MRRGARFTALVGLAALVLAACGSGNSSSTDEPDAAGTNGQATDGKKECTDTTPVTLRLNWIVNFNHVPIATAQERGYFKDACLDVKIEAGQGSGDTVTSVASGAAQIGLADTISIIQGQTKKLPVEGVAVLWQLSPAAVIIREDALKSRNITDPKPSDLEGMKFGAIPSAAVYTYWKAFVKVTGIDASKIKELPMSPPATGAMARGSVDFITDFSAGHFPLDRLKVPTKLMMMRDFGVKSYGLGITVNKEWLGKNEDAVKGFLTALARGMMYSGEHPDESIDYLVKLNPDVGASDETREAELLPHKETIDIWADGGMSNAKDFLKFTNQGLEETLNVLKTAGNLESGADTDITQSWTDKYLPAPESFMTSE